MKKTIIIKDEISSGGKETKIIKKEVNIRNLDHFEIQKKTRMQIHRPKKGKGSWRRKEKYRKVDDE